MHGREVVPRHGRRLVRVQHAAADAEPDLRGACDILDAAAHDRACMGGPPQAGQEPGKGAHNGQMLCVRKNIGEIM